MADEKDLKGGALDGEDDAGGAGGKEKKPTDDSSGNGGGKGEPKVVPWDDHKRALDDLHKFKKEKKELEARIGSIESDRLKEKEDFKGLYEKEKADKERLNGEFSSFNQSVIAREKLNAVTQEAIKQGLVDKSIQDLALIDLKDIEVEVTSSGRWIVRGADNFVTGLKSSRPHWFQDKKAPRVNGGGGGNPLDGNGPITPSELYEVERKFGAKSQKYHDLYNRYLKQGAGAGKT